MGEWKKSKLDDVTSYINRGYTPKYVEQDGIIIINQKCIRDGRINLSFSKKTNLKKKITPEKMLQKGDIIINSTGVGTAGRIGMFQGNYRATTDSHTTIVRLNKALADSSFIFYNLRKREKDIESYAEGSTGQVELSHERVKFIDVYLPPLPEQKAIASVLSSLDDKIDLLHRQNKTLESMAKVLFRSEFEENEDEWDTVALEDVTDRITDGAHRSPPTVQIGMPMASVKDMRDWDINTETCRNISPDDFEKLERGDCKPLKNDILIAKDGSYLKHVFMVEETMRVVILSSIAILRPNFKYHPMLLSIFLKLDSTRNRMENIVSGAVIPRIVLKDFRKFEVGLPPEDVQNSLLEQISPLYQKCWTNNKQIQTLEKLRDTLLPKLMSGKVRVAYDQDN
ncbi:hypothetical protein TI03_01930 [Achromatium sp. WMS1]|nr:hypothetical protein TI03_01930 [Achromatium sp. WMS1]